MKKSYKSILMNISDSGVKILLYKNRPRSISLGSGQSSLNYKVSALQSRTLFPADKAVHIIEFYKTMRRHGSNIGIDLLFSIIDFSAER